MSNASAQVRVDLTAIKDSVACFGSGRQAEYCAVLELAGSQQSLAKVDEAKQEELLAGYAQFLNSLTFVFQLVVQVHPVDLALRGARRRACALPITIAGCHRSRSRCVCPGFDPTTHSARAPNLCRGAMVGRYRARKRAEPRSAVAL